MKRQPKPIDPAMEILLHSLGFEPPFFRNGLDYEPYRNSSCFCDGEPIAERLVAARLMRRGPTINEGRDRIYVVTSAGLAVARAFVRSWPRQTRDQKRYAAFLRASDAWPDLTFREWLRMPAVERGCA